MTVGERLLRLTRKCMKPMSLNGKFHASESVILTETAADRGGFSEKIIFLKKPIDKSKDVWYNASVKKRNRPVSTLPPESALGQ